MATAVEPSPPSALCKQVSQGSLFGPDSVEPGTDLQDVGTLRCQRRLPQEAPWLRVLYTVLYIHACLYTDGCSRFRLRFHVIHRVGWKYPAILIQCTQARVRSLKRNVYLPQPCKVPAALETQERGVRTLGFVCVSRGCE